MTDTLAFQIRALTRVAVSPMLSRVEGNITNDTDVENSDESVAFSVLVQHKKQPSHNQLLVLALERAQYILTSQSSPVSAQRDHSRVPTAPNIAKDDF